MCIAVLLIIGISDWAWAEDVYPTDRWNYEFKPNKKSTTVQAKFLGVRCKWKLNKLELKRGITSDVDSRIRFTMDDLNKGRAVALITFTW